MNRALIPLCACFASVAALCPLAAQEDSGAAAETGGTDAAAIDPAIVQAASAKPAARHFHALVRFVRASADVGVSVRLPKAAGFVPAVEGKFYPNGSVFRVADGGADASAEFEFGKDAVLKAFPGSEFGTRETDIGSPQRTVTPVRGAFAVALPRTLPTGLFTVAYPNFTAKDLAGESRHELTPSGDGDEAVVHVKTGMLSLEGPHYSVARMSAADRVRIRTTGDALFTSLRGEAGDYKVALDQGVTSYRDPISGAVSNQVRHLDFSLTPQCAIKIFRKRSQVGGRMAVSVMTFDPAGEMKNRFTFAEGAASVNFGEEVVRIQDISFKTKKDEAGAKKDDAKPAEDGSGESSSSSESGEQGSGEQQQGSESGGDSGAGF